MSGVVVVVGDPRPGSRTRLAGELVAERWAGPDRGPTTVIELADLGPALLEWGSDAAAVAVTTVLRADALVVVSPTYKASFTGLLKLFLDQFDADALDDLPTVPLLTGGSDVHRLAVDLHLTPVLLEIGASVPARGIWLSGHDVDHPEPAVDRWFTRHRDTLARGALGPRPSPPAGIVSSGGSMTTDNRLHLNIFGLGTGRHEASWRHPAVDPSAGRTFESYRRLAETAERGKFDGLFLADGLTIGPVSEHFVRGGFEPLTLLAALAPVTTHLGLIATATTTYAEPFNVARQFASIDHLSAGRAGWNIVTSSEGSAAANFSARTHPPHAERYERAEEFVDIVLALWDSWEEGAIIADKASGIYADPTKIHPIDFHGAYFDVLGPLNIDRPPQGRPLLVQAGSSDTGAAFGARYADAIFTAQPILEGAQEIYSDYKARAKDAGRDPDSIKILPGISPVIGGTQAEAQALLDELNELTIPAYGLASLKNITGLDLSNVPLDAPVPIDASEGLQYDGLTSRLQVALQLGREGSLTVRQLLHRFAEGFGHRIVVGTPEQIADEIEYWFQNGAADGFNVMPPYIPDTFDAFVDHVVPELQQRGIFRREYEGTTLREHYGVA